MRNIIRFIALLSHDPLGKALFLALIYEQKKLYTVQEPFSLVFAVLVMEGILFKDESWVWSMF